MFDFKTRMTNKYDCFKVQDGIIVIKTTARKYRLAKMTRDGNGFTNYNKPMTGIREFEFITDNLSHAEMITAIEQYASEKTTIEI